MMVLNPLLELLLRVVRSQGRLSSDNLSLLPRFASWSEPELGARSAFDGGQMAKRIILEPQGADSMLEERVGQKLEPEAGTSQPSGWIKIAGGASALLMLLIYLLQLDSVVGLFGDDAWYVLLAKSLASGQGYTLINSPSPGIMPLYPPAFPFLLSLVFRLSPEFPANLWLLKSVSIVAMLGTGIMAYHYFTRDRELPPYVALGIAVAAVLNPVIVVMATSTVMSECVFTFNFLLTIVVIERAVRAGKNGQAMWHYAALGAVLASFAFLTRSIAVSLILAVLLYLLKERLGRAALIFAAVVAVLTGSWMIYARAHAPTPEQQKAHGGNIVQPYTAQFWQREAGNALSGTVSAGDLPARVWNNITQIAGRDVGHLLVTQVFEQGTASAGGERLFFSWLLSALAIAGLVSVVRERITLAEIAVPLSLGVTVLWPFETVRFVLPLLPFIIFYSLMGCRAVQRLHQRLRHLSSSRQPWAVIAVMAACLAAVSLYGNAQSLSKRYGGSSVSGSRMLNVFHEVETMCRWMDQSLPKESVIATNVPPLVYLYTGRQAISRDDPAGNWGNWNRLGVRYMATFPLTRIGVDPSENRYHPIYRAPGNAGFRVVDLGDPATRAPWGAPVSASPMRMPSSR